MCKGGKAVNSTDQKYFLLMRTLSEGKATVEELAAVDKAIHELSETEQVEFNNFQHKVGEVFLKIREELDEGLEELADRFPEETDPRKWDADDWLMFEEAVTGHKFQMLYITYATQTPNINLMWEEIKNRL